MMRTLVGRLSMEQPRLREEKKKYAGGKFYRGERRTKGVQLF